LEVQGFIGSLKGVIDAFEVFYEMLDLTDLIDIGLG
jgi:hypothetical protein